MNMIRITLLACLLLLACPFETAVAQVQAEAMASRRRGADETELLADGLSSTTQEMRAAQEKAIDIFRGNKVTIKRYAEARILMKLATVQPQTAMSQFMKPDAYSRWCAWTKGLMDDGESFELADFFGAGLFLVGDCGKENRLICYYHPWSDVAMLAQMDVSEDALLIDDFCLLPGEELRKGIPESGFRNDEAEALHPVTSMFWIRTLGTQESLMRLSGQKVNLNELCSIKRWSREGQAEAFCNALTSRLLEQGKLLKELQAVVKGASESSETVKMLVAVMNWLKGGKPTMQFDGYSIDEVSQLCVYAYFGIDARIREGFQMTDCLSLDDAVVFCYSWKVMPQLSLAVTVPRDRKRNVIFELVDLLQPQEDFVKRMNAFIDTEMGEEK